MTGAMANDRRSPLPLQTGHGDFPHPAFARVVSSRKHSQGCLAFWPSFCLSSRGSAAGSPPERKGKLLPRLFCRRNVVHSNQLRVPLTRLDSGQGSLAPQRLDHWIGATMSPSDSLFLTSRRLWLPVVRSPAPGLGIRQGLPSSWWLFRRALSPITPGSLKGALGRLFPFKAGFTLSDRLATPMFV